MLATQMGGIDTYTKLLIHFNGSDGSTDDYTAETGQTVTTVGTAQLDTAQYKFGTASMLLDGDSDYCTVPDNANWAFGTGAFTVELWIRKAAMSGYRDFFDTRDADADTGGFSLFWEGNDNLVLYIGAARITDATNRVADTWYHIAVVGNGGADGARTIKMYVDGTQVGSTYTVNYNFDTQKLRLGANWNNAQYHNGWIDEVRISKGIQRWTADFTPSTYPYNDYSDIGLRYYDNGIVNAIPVQTLSTHKLRVRDGDTTYGIPLLATTDTYAGALRIYDGSATKAIP